MRDSKSAIGMVQSNKKVKDNSVLCPEMELILEIKRLKSKNNELVERKYEWVRSHQGKNVPTVEDTLNERADTLVTECRHNVEQDLIMGNKKQVYVGSRATLAIKGTVVNKNLKKSMSKALYAEDMRNYLIKNIAGQRKSSQISIGTP